FRHYFDPAMLYLDLCAALLRNWHFREFWMRAGMRGFAEAGADPVFARVAGSTFGGLEVRPPLILTLVWSRIFGDLSAGGAQMFLGFLSGRFNKPTRLIGDFGAWQRGLWRSRIEDPVWTASWLADVAKKAARVQATLWASDNPRVKGIAL